MRSVSLGSWAGNQLLIGSKAHAHHLSASIYTIDPQIHRGPDSPLRPALFTPGASRPPRHASIPFLASRSQFRQIGAFYILIIWTQPYQIGIGDPLINFGGNLVGMNFYDGCEETPFLPKSKIVNVLKRKICFHYDWKEN